MEGSRAIHIACAMGKNEILTSLYKHGAEMDVKNYNGISPIHLAAINNHPFCITYLVEKGVDID